MYKFRDDINVDFKDRKKASEEIGINYNTLGMIIRGDLNCSKAIAYYITKLLYSKATIEDFFVKVKGEKDDD